MIKGKTLTKRDILDKPRGKIKVGSLEANSTIYATENKNQWLHLVDGGWVSAGPRQRYIQWEVVPDQDVTIPPPAAEVEKIITGKTIVERDTFDKPRGKKIGIIEANTEITASENKNQWLHLVDGNWVSAGSRKQYIQWQLVEKTDSDTTPEVDPDPIDTSPPDASARRIIRGRTKIKRDVFDKPRGEIVIGRLEADESFRATENVLQWLHLENGGWVSAGPRQRYIKWETVIDRSDPDASQEKFETVITPSPPIEPWEITEFKRAGKIATLLVDWQNPKWEYSPRHANSNKYFNHPQTVTFNSIPHSMKGPRIRLTDEMTDYLEELNGEKVKDIILEPQAGWINHPTVPPTIERISWAANHVIVKEAKIVKGVEYSNLVAINCYETNLIGTFFDKDMRLIIHKFNSVNRKSNLAKLTNARDCYTPFITDPRRNNGDMWIRSDYLEMWPELPFTLTDGSEIIEYELFGYEIYGRRADGKSILLRDPKGFKTNWRINSPEVPV